MNTIRKLDQIAEDQKIMTKMTFISPNKELYLHWHNVFEVIRVTEGRFCVSLNGEDLWIKEGDCLLISPGCIHDIGLNKSEASAMILQFPLPEIIDRISKKDSSLDFFLYSGYTDSHGRLIPAGSKYSVQAVFLCDEIYRSSQECEQITDGIIRGAVQMLLTYFTRETLLRIDQWKTDDKFDMVKLCGYIDSLELPSVGLSEAAAYLCYSEKYFSSKFRRITGIGFKHFIDSLKMQEVRRMLGEGMNATEIAELLGYSCVQNLSRSFRRIHKMSISEMMNKKK